VNAFDGFFLLSQGYGANQTGLLAAAATDAAVLVKDHTAVWPLLHGARGASAGTGRVLAAAADHNAKIALNAALRLHLDGAVLQGDGACARAAASEHAAKAADAALGMSHLEAASRFWLCSNYHFFCSRVLWQFNQLHRKNIAVTWQGRLLKLWLLQHDHFAFN
jgi:hypothetical protein